MTTKKNISVTIDSELYDFIYEKAKANNRSVSNFIEQTIRQHYAKQLKRKGKTNE